MPLLVASHPDGSVDPGEPPILPEYAHPVVGVHWTAPDGSVHDLMQWTDGPIALQDWVGFGAAPRTVSTRDLPSGGTMPRWSHAGPKMLGIPLLVRADDHGEFLRWRRRLTVAFTQTTPPSGVPRLGTLRVTRADGSWREIQALYQDGLEWNEADGSGVFHDTPVIQLMAPDPWWYEETLVAVEFGVEEPRNYLDPYETVSSDRALGEDTVTVESDVDVSPIWEIHGPASSVTVRYDEPGPGWTFGNVDAGEVITIDVAKATVRDQSGANRIGDLAWPTSSLFPLSPGDNHLLLSLSNGVEGQSMIRLSYRPRRETP